jgi:molybdate-binding protein/DNA-binding XRE family transcriptional regulator
VQQRDLASQIGVSRQTLSSIEAGTTIPSTQIALALARTLQCRVEDIFVLEEDAKGIEVQFIRDLPSAESAAAAGSGGRVRVVIAHVGKQWIARSLDGDQFFAPGTPADGIAAMPSGKARVCATRVRPLRDLEALSRNLFVAGCDPALGLLGRHVEERLRGPRLHWMDLPSRSALDELAAGRVHVAGLHMDDLSAGNLNVATVRDRFGTTPMLLVTLATWELGIVCRGQQKLKDAGDLTRKGLRVVGREPGAGAQQLLESALDRAGLSMSNLNVVATARGHRAVAQLVASGIGDAGIATRAAATPFGLTFVPLAESRFDLALTAEVASDERVQAMLDCLSSSRFRKDVGAMIGYRANKTGDTVKGVDA